MPGLIANAIYQSTATTGTGPYTLESVTGWRDIADQYSTGGTDVFIVCIRHRGADEILIATAHLSDTTTLAIDTVRDSTAGGSLVDFSAGYKDVWVGPDVEYLQDLIYTDAEAESAINNDTDHGQTAHHDFGTWD